MMCLWLWLVDENVGVRAARELADCAGAVPWVEAGVRSG
jgi:hypothetical protein